jgi:phosphate transport system substrate-binding protein
MGVHLSRITPLTVLAVSCLAAMLLSNSPTADAQDREQIRIVGSSTVYPFSNAVAEELGKATRFRTPKVESTGSGGGHKLFGAGLGPDTADITNSSRRMTVSEYVRAQANGVTRITEAVIGYDGIAIAQNVSNEPVALKTTEITLAVAAEVPDPAGSGRLVKNPYHFWDEISDRLPHRRIRIYGPPSTSGTRDAFEELCLEATTPGMSGYGGKYKTIRQDGSWVDSGENDDLIVRKLTRDKDALGVFGFSFLEKNLDKIQGIKVNGVDAKFETIYSGEYPLSRSLYFYIKLGHLRQVPGVFEYAKLFMDEQMIGEKGELRQIGLVPLPPQLRKASRDRVLQLDPLTLREGRLSTLEQYAKERGFLND